MSTTNFLLAAAIGVALIKAPQLGMSALVGAVLIGLFVCVIGPAMSDNMSEVTRSGNSGCGLLWFALIVVVAVIVLAAALGILTAGRMAI